MDIQISTYHLSLLLEQAAEMGAQMALTHMGKLKPYLKKSEAFRLYGRKNVEQWIGEGLVKPRKDGDCSATWRLERMELAAIAKSNEALRYL
jgi:hypothetical protein